MKFRFGTMTFLAFAWGDLTKDFYTPSESGEST